MAKSKWLCLQCMALLDDVFYCLCSVSDKSMADDHGESSDNPCPRAACDRCQWAGLFPPTVPIEAPEWMQLAVAAGWTPPTGRWT